MLCMIFEIFDPSLLTIWINCSCLHLSPTSINHESLFVHCFQTFPTRVEVIAPILPPTSTYQYYLDIKTIISFHNRLRSCVAELVGILNTY